MSKKYVIEIKPEYEDSFKGLMLLGAKDSNLFVDTLAVEDLEELNSNYINEHYSDLQDDAYQRGLNDAWECGKKLAWTAKYGGYGERLNDVFGRDDAFDFYDYTPNEAIEKLKSFEQKQDDKIEVGDTVNLKDGSRDNDGIVTKSWDNDRHFIMWADGSGGVWDKEYIVKTGRHFDIASILEDMRND